MHEKCWLKKLNGKMMNGPCKCVDWCYGLKKLEMRKMLAKIPCVAFLKLSNNKLFDWKLNESGNGTKTM